MDEKQIGCRCTAEKQFASKVVKMTDASLALLRNNLGPDRACTRSVSATAIYGSILASVYCKLMTTLSFALLVFLGPGVLSWTQHWNRQLSSLPMARFLRGDGLED